MEPAIDRIMMTYDLLVNRSAAASAEARAKVTDYLATLMDAAEHDVLAYMSFPKERRAKLHSTNPIERRPA